ncbi:thiol reductant ABC exporter subunit CydD [Kineosporia sp. J2-2]|uniref:Thiol reductant ABC exporter subunit CydD n=1 Tax=Kineosporia corallincola TaxID=2835133 RepID=A0ABS5TL76_9ACTN|nr:thiol reductant ABC exporter subunit CydD [Kineosporia corallincola]MBT0771860.1 thiol reductant ABC exporter subunit CydD [Kineosporia corallincola]
MSTLQHVPSTAPVPAGGDGEPAAGPPASPRPRGPVDARVFRLVPAMRRDAVLLGSLAALGALALLGQLVTAAWAVTAYSTGEGPWPPLTGFLLATLARGVLRGAEHALTARAAGRARVRFGAAIAGAALRMPPARLAATGPGAVSALATNGVDTLEKYVTRYLPAVVPAVVLPPAVVVVLAVLDPRSAVIVVVTLPLVPLFAALVGWATQRRSEQQWQLMSRLSSHFLDVVQGLVTLRAHRRAGRQVEVLAEVGEQHRAATVRVLRLAFLSGTALDLVATLSVGLVAVEAGLRVAAGDLGLGTALVAILIAPEAYRPVRELGARFHESADAAAVLDEATAVIDAGTDAGTDAVPVAPDAPLPAGVALLADGITVSLPGRPDPVLAGVGLWVLGGQITAITGPSGVGKTTLVRVLAGQLAPGSGLVRRGAPVDGEHLVAYLPQRPTFPLARTLRDAVGAGWPQAPAAAFDQALRDACCDWIGQLPAGPDTPLAEDGRDLSAGQRQRLALARTFLHAARLGEKGSPVVLLDEPTAHLDEHTERRVLDGLRRRAGDGTAIVMVAHRPAAIAAADEVSHLYGTVPRASRPGRAAPSHLSHLDLGACLDLGSCPDPTFHLDLSEAELDACARGFGWEGWLGDGDNRLPQKGGSKTGEDLTDAGEKPPHEPAGTFEPQGSGAARAPAPGSAPGSAAPAPRTPDRDDAVLPGFGRAWAAAAPARSWLPKPLRTASMNLALVLGTLSSLSGVALTAVAAWLLTRASGQPPILTLTVAVVGVRLFAVARPLFGYLERLVAHDVALADLGRLRARVYADLIPRVPGPALPRRGDLLTRLVDDVDAVADTVLRWRRPVIVAAGTLVVAVAAGALVDPLAAAAALPGLLLAGLVAPLVAGSGAGLRAHRTAAARAGYAQAVVEVLAGAEDVRALGVTRSGVVPVREAGERAVRADLAQARRNALAEFLRTVGAGLAVAGVMLATTLDSTLGLEQVGVLVLGTLALADVTATLPDAVNARTRGRIAHRRLSEVLDTPPASVDPVDAETVGAETVCAETALTSPATTSPATTSPATTSPATTSPATTSPATTGPAPAGPGPTGVPRPATPGIALDQVVAGWDARRPPVLDGLDLELAPGQRIAVQGPSGCGKSTLAGIVLKFLDPRAGSARLDGRDYRDLTGDRVRGSVSLVSDDDHVFAGTLRENLLLASPSATDAELRVVLTRARLGHWFNSTPQGLGTRLGERGATMSAGERRRLALARALLAGRPVLVLDEPAESLDTETAQAVLGDLLETTGGCSVLLVTHRSEGLDAMDRVLRLEDGGLRAGT